MAFEIPRAWVNWIGDSLGGGVIFAVGGLIAALALVAVTLSDMGAIPKEVWRAAPYPSRALRWATRVGFVLVPVGLIASLVWWTRVAPSLRPEGTPDSPKPLTAAWRRTYHAGVSAFAIMGFFSLFFGVGNALTPDPETVYIQQLGHEISPRPYIAQHCPDSVLTVDRIDAHPFGVDRDLERWDVTPRPGHVDVVLLNVVSGEVVCP